VPYGHHDVLDPASYGRPTPEFLITKEHRRFIEFADACRRERYIGLCYGPPGVGKTLSARQYAHWDTITPAMMDRFGEFRDPFEDSHDAHPFGPEILAETRSVLWTPNVTVSPRQVDYDMPMLCRRFNVTVERHLSPQTDFFGDIWHVELLIVDEADRLKTTGLEQLRDFFDRRSIGLILIGMPGLEKRLARYPQLYSRIGFAHHYRPLSTDELHFVLTHHWQKARPHALRDRLHRRRSRRDRRAHHRRQLPARPPPLRPDPARARDQRAADRHPRSRRNRPRDAGYRRLTRATHF
jgi:hypothetical protein